MLAHLFNNCNRKAGRQILLWRPACWFCKRKNKTCISIAHEFEPKWMIGIMGNFLQTIVGKFVFTFCISMVPIIELRGGLPYGISLGLPYPLAHLAALLGNIFPIPFVVVYIRRVFKWLQKRNEKLDLLVMKLEARAHLKGHLVKKYSLLGLCLLVAIPLPGTGAWTGALVAALFDLRLKRAIPAILLGICIAATLITAVMLGIKSAIQ